MEYIKKDMLVKDCRNIDVTRTIEEALKPIAACACQGDVFAVKLFEPCLKISLPLAHQFYEDAFALLQAFDSSKCENIVADFLASFLNLPRNCFTVTKTVSGDNGPVKKEANLTQCK